MLHKRSYRESKVNQSKGFEAGELLVGDRNEFGYIVSVIEPPQEDDFWTTF